MSQPSSVPSRSALCAVHLLILVPLLPAVAAVSWETHPGYRCRSLELPKGGRTGFTLVDPKQSGVLFTNILSDQNLNMDSTLLSGSGVALGDIDGDGLCDIYLCSLAGRNALFHNLGNWQFEEIAEKAGVACPGQISRGAVFADVDGDGTLDLLVTARGGGVRLFLNDGKGNFHEVAPPQSGLATNTGSTSLALADVDGNGTLDLYVANFGVGSVLREGGQVTMRMINGKMVVVGRHSKRIKVMDGKLVEFGEPDVLYLNDGHGHFTPVPWEQGAFLDEKGQPAQTPWDYGLSVQMRDLNGDGWPDIYVCNDFFTPDRIWINDRHGHFRAIDTLAIRKTSYASMGVDFADIDRTGHMSGLIVEMLARDPAARLRQMTPDVPGPPILRGLDRPQTGRNTLLWNRGDGTFAEIAYFCGLAASDWSWMPAFLDVDLDGYEDALITNGATYDLLDLDVMQTKDVQDGRTSGRAAVNFPRIETPNCVFRNNGDRTFTECGHAWGFDSKLAGNGMALADLDNDGDLDVVVNCLNGGALLYRNESSSPRIAVRLRGLSPNTQGIGAMVTVRGGAVPSQSQEIISGGRFLSGDDPMRVFAAGTLTNLLTIEVAWRSGKRSLVTNAFPNHLYEIEEAATATAPVAAAPKPRQPLFKDATEQLGHVHHQEPFDDMERQQLIPKRLSQLGPGVAWCDLNGDGTETLVIGNGRGASIAAYRWNGTNRFVSTPPPAGSQLTGNSAGMAAVVLAGKPALLIAQSNYELNSTGFPPVLALSAAAPAGLDLRVATAATNVGAVSVGPIAAADIDGDGELEVFVGGRVIPGRYPEAASSFILRNQNGALIVDTTLSEPLKNIGLVSSAVFSDLDGDGWPELILTLEWGPLRIFHNDHGRLTPWDVPITFNSSAINQPLTINQLTGWWQSVTTGDVDGDGKMDIIAGNWGLNSRYQCDVKHPLVLYYGDFNGDGSTQIFETCYDWAGAKLLAARHLRIIGAAMPFVLERFGSNHTFSEASATQILGDRMPRAHRVEANTLASMVLLNRGDHFEARLLPDQAQWAPVFGIAIADLDGDGHEDILLAQNFFGTPAEGARQDAGRGLVLKGDGAGGFTPIPGDESGVRVYGEQRGCALADYDGDGRVDAVICQNAEATRLFHNVGATPGLRIRLRGPPGNPNGVGAVLRLGANEKFGPAREIHAGSGYWSQDSAVQLMDAQGKDQLWIRWPGGKTTTTRLPASAREIEVSVDGSLRTVR